MFLLFRSSGLSKCLKTKFTFQYVSIISSGCSNVEFVYFEFTFQYVSIISANDSQKLFSVLAIYIPICFYYFVLLHDTDKLTDAHLHSNMFLLFLQFQDMQMQSVPIYIPICFYYFTVVKVVPVFKEHLHSNMFLLFLFSTR